MGVITQIKYAEKFTFLDPIWIRIFCSDNG